MKITEFAKYHKDKIFLFVILLFLIPLYLFKLDTIPTSVHGDEAETALQAISMLENDYSIIGTGWFSLPLLSFFPHALFMLIFGQNIFADRLGSVFFGILTLPAFFILIKHLFDRKLALISTVLFGTSHLWLALSRLGIAYVQATFFIILVILLLVLGKNKVNKIYFTTAGLFFGLSFYSNFAIRILPFLVLAFFIHYFAIQKILNFKHKLFSLFAFITVSVVVFLPQGLYYLQNPQTLLSRESTIYVFSENAKKWTNYNNLSNLEIFFEQSKNTFNLLKYDNSTQYRYQGSIVDLFSLILVVLGLGFLLTKLREFRYQLLLLWITLAFLAQILTSIPPPFFLPRFSVGIPILVLFISLGIMVVTNFFRNFIHQNLLLSILLGIIIIFNLVKYFHFYPQQITGDPNARSATKIADVINKHHANKMIYFYTSPSLYADFGTLRFLSPHIKKTNLDIREKLYIAEGKPVYIIYPQYFDIIQKLSSNYKKTSVENYKDLDGNTQFYLFEVK